VVFGELDELGVPGRVGGDGEFFQHPAGAGIDHRCGVGVHVGVDADDNIDDLA